MHLARFPRIRLAHLPTPLEPLPRLSEALAVVLCVGAALLLTVTAAVGEGESP